jgi:hypothetical protein
LSPRSATDRWHRSKFSTASCNPNHILISFIYDRVRNAGSSLTHSSSACTQKEQTSRVQEIFSGGNMLATETVPHQPLFMYKEQSSSIQVQWALHDLRSIRTSQSTPRNTLLLRVDLITRLGFRL